MAPLAERVRRRVVYRVVWSPDGWGIQVRLSWQVRTPKKYTAIPIATRSKRDAVLRARAWARNAWETQTLPSQLVVCRRDGTVQLEHSYGTLPR